MRVYMVYIHIASSRIKINVDESGMTLVDSREISKFNNIARSYWDPEGPMRALHQINPLRIDFVESYYPLQDAKVLDVGCGGGDLLQKPWPDAAVL